MGRRNTSRSGGGSSNATTRRDHLRQFDGRADNWRSRRDNLLTEEDSEAETMRMMAGSIQRENHARVRARAATRRTSTSIERRHSW